MPRLIVLTGPDAGHEFRLKDGELSIGRQLACDFVLSDPQVSRKHGSVEIRGDRLIVTDAGSGNGTIVGDVKVTRAELASGERFTVGDSTILFLAKGAKPPGIVRTLPGDAGSVILAKPAAAGTDWLRQRLLHLGVLYEAFRASREIGDRDELLGRLLDLAMRTTGADCGSVFLDDPASGEWLPLVRRTGPNKPAAISRTIVEYVKTERVGVLATDAGMDNRFAGGESIARHGIRSVIAVPLTGRHDPVGALVLETFADGAAAFSDDHLTLAAALAHQAALVVEENRWHVQMLNAGKLAAVGQAMASLSHHIKNIMHGVRFGSDLVRRGIADNDRELLETGWALVEKNQDRIDSLTQNMLGYAKDREPLRGAVDLRELIAEIVESLRQKTAEARATIEVATTGDPVASCDRHGIHRALLNLVTNALDAVREVDGGRIGIDLTRDAESVAISVGDNGPGIDPRDAEAIFEPFISRKGSQGTGLGLPVSRKILREHGGTLTWEPSPSGARFTMRWPVEAGTGNATPGAFPGGMTTPPP
jgi:signal transduction histidine kinase